jgi:hypothetical protein
MDILHALWAATRLGWWRFVLWSAPDGWEGRTDALWFEFVAHQELKKYLEGL